MTIASLSIISQHRTGCETKVMQIYLSAPPHVRNFLEQKCQRLGKPIHWPSSQQPAWIGTGESEEEDGVDLYRLLSWMEESCGPLFQVATEKNENVQYLFRSQVVEEQPAQSVVQVPVAAMTRTPHPYDLLDTSSESSARKAPGLVRVSTLGSSSRNLYHVHNIKVEATTTSSWLQALSDFIVQRLAGVMAILVLAVLLHYCHQAILERQLEQAMNSWNLQQQQTMEAAAAAQANYSVPPEEEEAAIASVASSYLEVWTSSVQEWWFVNIKPSSSSFSL